MDFSTSCFKHFLDLFLIRFIGFFLSWRSDLKLQVCDFSFIGMSKWYKFNMFATVRVEYICISDSFLAFGIKISSLWFFEFLISVFSWVHWIVIRVQYVCYGSSYIFVLRFEYWIIKCFIMFSEIRILIIHRFIGFS